ncbi:MULTISPECIES: carbohydrate ABC transporter permease [Gracilibacillus]|uniref:carbohydrate ABC transporter permease n=1 Tax=Gracilibacillus TaxID=74385 RepID=UPI00098FB2D3|nr:MULTISPECIES: carbohydrate ABC transporter permease [Gracilibacillus]
MSQVGEKKLSQIVMYTFMFVCSILSIFPFYWMFVVGSNTTSAINHFPPAIIPGSNFFDNTLAVFDKIPFLQVLWNSVFISVVVTVSVLFFCSLAGFAFSKLNFKGRDGFFIFVIATMMIPPQLSLIPNFMIMTNLGWVDDLKAVIVPAAVNAFGVFWMRQYISSAVPYELIEAGRIDGCSNFRIFLNIVLPAVRPGLATLGIFTFMATWNDFLWPLVVLKDSSVQTLQIALRTLNDVYNTDYSLILTGTFLATLPILLVFLIFSRQFISGLTEGAIK